MALALESDGAWVRRVSDEELSIRRCANELFATSSSRAAYSQRSSGLVGAALPRRIVFVGSAAIEHDDVDELVVLSIEIAHDVVEVDSVVAQGAVAVVTGQQVGDPARLLSVAAEVQEDDVVTLQRREERAQRKRHLLLRRIQ